MSLALDVHDSSSLFKSLVWFEGSGSTSVKVLGFVKSEPVRHHLTEESKGLFVYVDWKSVRFLEPQRRYLAQNLSTIQQSISQEIVKSREHKHTCADAVNGQRVDVEANEFRIALERMDESMVLASNSTPKALLAISRRTSKRTDGWISRLGDGHRPSLGSTTSNL